MSESIIHAENVCFAYPRQENVLHNLCMQVPKGCVYGFLGRNGSGKTTFIQLLLGTLRPRVGDVRVLGRQVHTEAIAIRKRIGYVPQEDDFDPDMKVASMLKFISKFYPENWDDDFVQQLLDRFEVPEGKRIGQLSKGLRGRLALVASLGNQPDLLILDEPTAGLDPVVRRDFLEVIVDFMASGERTVFFSSHLLNEVERMADHVAIVDRGSILLETSVSQLKARLARYVMRFEQAPNQLRIPNAVSCRRIGEAWHVAAWVDNADDRLRLEESLKATCPVDMTSAESDLESIFVDLVGENHVR